MKHILKQTSWLLIAQVLTKIVGFFYTIFLAKNLGVDGYGLYTVAFAYFSILSSIADFGFNRFLVRELSQKDSKIYSIIWSTVILRLTLSSVIFALFAAFMYAFDPDKLRVNLSLLASLAIIPQAIGLTFDGIFIVFKRVQFSALSLLVSTITMSSIGWFLVSRGFGAIGAINALIVGQFILAAFCFTLIILMNKFHFSKIEFSVFVKAIKGSLPYGLLGILGLLYFRIDSIMLSYLKGTYDAGMYGISYRFLETIIFIPSSFAVVLFPNMARLHVENFSDLKKLYFKSLRLMFVSGLVLLLGFVFVLPTVIKMYLPNYIPAIDSVKILSLSIPFIFMATPGVQVLLSTSKYLKQVLFFSLITLFFNISLNFLFIPKYGFLGSSVVTVLSDILSFLIFFALINFYIFKKK